MKYADCSHATKAKGNPSNVNLVINKKYLYQSFFACCLQEKDS